MKYVAICLFLVVDASASFQPKMFDSRNSIPACVMVPYCCPTLIDLELRHQQVAEESKTGNLSKILKMFFYKPLPLEPFRITTHEPYCYLNPECMSSLLQSIFIAGESIGSDKLFEKIRETMPSDVNKQPKRLKLFLNNVADCLKKVVHQPLESTFLIHALLTFALKQIVDSATFESYGHSIVHLNNRLTFFNHEDVSLFFDAYENLPQQLCVLHNNLPSPLSYKSDVVVTHYDGSTERISDCGETTLRFLCELIQAVCKDEDTASPFIKKIDDFFKQSKYNQKRFSSELHNQWASLIASCASHDSLSLFKNRQNCKSSSLMSSINNIMRVVLWGINTRLPAEKVSPLLACAFLNMAFLRVLSKNKIIFSTKCKQPQFDETVDNLQQVSIKIFCNSKKISFMLCFVPEHIWITPLYKQRHSTVKEKNIANQLLLRAVENFKNNESDYELNSLLLIYARHFDYSIVGDDFYSWYDKLLVAHPAPTETALAKLLGRYSTASKLDYNKIFKGKTFLQLAYSLQDFTAIQLLLRTMKKITAIRNLQEGRELFITLRDRLEDSQQQEFIV